MTESAPTTTHTPAPVERAGPVGARRGRWSSLSPRARRLVIAAALLFGLAIVVLAAIAGGFLRGLGAGAAPPFVTASPSPTESATPAQTSTATATSTPTRTATPTPSPTATSTTTPTSTPTTTATATSTPSPTASATADAQSVTGSDGRLTVLLLGSDHRESHPGYRTDTIMVVSVDPVTDQASAVSIPRDVARFPLPRGDIWEGKVNGLYQTYLDGGGHAAAGAQMKEVVGHALGIEIDFFAYIGFGGVTKLVDAVGGVTVTLEEPVDDPYYWVDPDTRGVHFPAGDNHLDGERALIFARTRKGDNDFERARRQQLLVMAAVEAVRERGLESVPALIELAKGNVATDLPLDSFRDVYEMVSEADLDDARRAVLGPSTYAYSIGGTDFALRLDVVRELCDEWFAPVEQPEDDDDGAESSEDPESTPDAESSPEPESSPDAGAPADGARPGRAAE